MSAQLLSWLGLAIGVLALAGLAWYCRDVAVIEPTVPAKAKRVYIRGLCPYCGETVALRSDGEPHQRFHRCLVNDNPPWRLSRPIEQAEAARIEPDVTRTWPPAKAEEGPVQS